MSALERNTAESACGKMNVSAVDRDIPYVEWYSTDGSVG
jgi:hypothetical protein